jgi:hypothetical protein
VLCFGAPIDVGLDLTPYSLRPEIQFSIIYTAFIIYSVFVICLLALLDFATYKCIFGHHFASSLSFFSFPLHIRVCMKFFDHDVMFFFFYMRLAPVCLVC